MALLPGRGESARSLRRGERREASGRLVEGPLADIRTNPGNRIVAGLRPIGESPLTLTITEEDKARERVCRA